jgi:NAD(P)H dehydrogenase (quinone)
MSKPKILVTGATGKTGMPTVEELCNKGWPVRAVVHKEDARSHKLQKLGAEVVVADLYDYEEMEAAMKGIGRASFLPPVQPYMIQAANVFAVAAHAAGLEHVVQLSQWLPHPSHPSLHTRQLWLTEQLLSMIPGATFTLINPGIFADPILQMLPSAVNMGVLPNLFSGLRTPSPSNEDMGRCVAAALMYPEKYAGQRYRPTSPQALDMNGMAAIIGKVIGRTVKVQNLPATMFLKAARVAGAGDFEITNVQYYIQESDLHVFDTHGPTTDVLELTGREPESFETIARRYAAMPFAQASLANKLKAITEFARILITPPLNTKRHDAAMEYPVPPNPTLAGNSTIWRQQHHTNSGAFTFAPQPNPVGHSLLEGARS